jgi:hypothetical protein
MKSEYTVNAVWIEPLVTAFLMDSSPEQTSSKEEDLTKFRAEPS